jgi:hypothetical protein
LKDDAVVIVAGNWPLLVSARVVSFGNRSLLLANGLPGGNGGNGEPGGTGGLPGPGGFRGGSSCDNYLTCDGYSGQDGEGPGTFSGE